MGSEEIWVQSVNNELDFDINELLSIQTLTPYPLAAYIFIHQWFTIVRPYFLVLKYHFSFVTCTISYSVSGVGGVLKRAFTA